MPELREADTKRLEGITLETIPVRDKNFRIIKTRVTFPGPVRLYGRKTKVVVLTTREHTSDGRTLANSSLEDSTNKITLNTPRYNPLTTYPMKGEEQHHDILTGIIEDYMDIETD